MRKNKGFTLIEIIAAIIIIGIIVLVANPLVQSFIISSRKSSFASNASAFLETVKAKMEMYEYGEIAETESMIVPLRYVKLEKGSTVDSPFGKYDLDRSYIIITNHNNSKGPAYQYHINLMDETGHAIKEGTFNTLNKNKVEAGDRNRMPTLVEIATNGYNCEVANTNCYEFLEKRDISGATGIAGSEVLILIKR